MQVQDDNESEPKSLESSSKYGSIPPYELNELLSHSLNSNHKVPSRLVSLDTFRGYNCINCILISQEIACVL